MFAFMKIGSLAFLPRQAAKYLVPAKKKRKFELKHSLAFPFLVEILPFSTFFGGGPNVIMHLIYVPDSDNLVFLWTMSYSLWTM